MDIAVGDAIGIRVQPDVLLIDFEDTLFRLSGGCCLPVLMPWDRGEIAARRPGATGAGASYCATRGRRSTASMEELARPGPLAKVGLSHDEPCPLPLAKVGLSHDEPCPLPLAKIGRSHDQPVLEHRGLLVCALPWRRAHPGSSGPTSSAA
jgi:hypothetical protein